MAAEPDTRTGPDVFAGSRPRGLSRRELTVASVLFAVLCLPLCLTLATQTAAADLGYPPQLGAPLAGRLYNPLAILTWRQLPGMPQGLFLRSLLQGVLSGVPLTLALAVIAVRLPGYRRRRSHSHGSAAWGTIEDAVAASLLPPERSAPQSGVFVGGIMDGRHLRYLRQDSQEHILVVAPTRSGKGVGLVNPTLLSWRESCVVSDIKGELWALTSGWRAAIGQHCIQFAPATPRHEILTPATDEHGRPLTDAQGRPVMTGTGTYNVARFNPFDEIRSAGSIEYYFDPDAQQVRTRRSSGEFEISDVQNIISLIADPQGKGELDHWGETASALLEGCLLYLKHNFPEGCSPRNLDNLLSRKLNLAAMRGQRDRDPAHYRDFPDEKQLWLDMAEGLDWQGRPYAARTTVMNAANDMLARPEEEGGSVLSTAKKMLKLYRDPIVAENTSVSDFKITQLMNLEQPVSLYLVTPPSDIVRLQPLLRLIISLITRILTKDMAFADGRFIRSYRHRLLFMLDEFPSLGKMDIIVSSLAFAGGFGLKYYIITQDDAQIKDRYGTFETISSNCLVQVYYAPLKLETAELISRKLGETTIEETSESWSGGGLLKKNVSHSKSKLARALLTPTEVLHLPGPVKTASGMILRPGNMIIIAGTTAFFGTQTLYFKDAVLNARSRVPACAASAMLTAPAAAAGSSTQGGPPC